MRVHLLYCVWCRRYAAQLKFLRTAAKELTPEATSAPAQRLSDQAKHKMRERLSEAARNVPPP
jgi:hypothetical protein